MSSKAEDFPTPFPPTRRRVHRALFLIIPCLRDATSLEDRLGLVYWRCPGNLLVSRNASFIFSTVRVFIVCRGTLARGNCRWIYQNHSNWPPAMVAARLMAWIGLGSAGAGGKRGRCRIKFGRSRLPNSAFVPVLSLAASSRFVRCIFLISWNRTL